MGSLHCVPVRALKAVFVADKDFTAVRGVKAHGGPNWELLLPY